MSIPATYASHLLSLAANRGIVFERLLKNSNLTAEEVHKQGARIALWQHINIITNLLQITNDPSIAIEVALQTKPSQIGFLSYGLMSCANLGEAVSIGQRFLTTVFPYFRLDFEIQHKTAILTLKDELSFSFCRNFIVENFIVRMSETFCSLLANQFNQNKYKYVELFFDYPEPNYFNTFKNRLPTAQFSQAANQIRFPAKLLELPLPTANSGIKLLALNQVESELVRLGVNEDWVDRTRLLLTCHNGQYPNLQSIAIKLNVSESTLKRKLAQSNESYSSLLDQVRSRDAYHLLSQSELSVEDVGLYLGYPDRANFTRAFRRWSNKTPTQYRNDLYKNKGT